jgi:hypothetical protein
MKQLGPVCAFKCQCSTAHGTVHQGEGHWTVLLTIWLPRREGVPMVGILHLSRARGPFHGRVMGFVECNVY